MLYVTNLRLTKQLADLAEPLDEVADPVQEAVNAVPQPVRDVLDGVWLGNPLHPALTDVPLGAWTAALRARPRRLRGGRRRARGRDPRRRPRGAHGPERLEPPQGRGAPNRDRARAPQHDGARRSTSRRSSRGATGSVASGGCSRASRTRAPRSRPTSADTSRSGSASASTGPRSRVRVTATRRCARSTELEDGKLVGVELEGESSRRLAARRRRARSARSPPACSHLGGPLEDGRTGRRHRGLSVARLPLRPLLGRGAGRPGGVSAAALRGARARRQGRDPHRVKPSSSRPTRRL